MRFLLFAAFALLILTGCGAGSGGVIEPEKKGAALSPTAAQPQGEKAAAAPPASP